MANHWPYDEPTRERVADQLVALLPAMLKVQDGQDGDLARFLKVLAAPLAGIRQNIEELHADLFIDTCGEHAIALLAEMVGTTLIFPDEQSNRRDVRGTVGWRRTKGTPPNLEGMAEELLGQLSVMIEGWKRVQMTQDLDMLRMERVVPDVRAAVLAEQATGPLDATFHAVDIRAITARTGRYHPRHVAHWFHPTRLFPVEDGTPTYVGGDVAWEPISGVPAGVIDPDWRYAFHPYRTTDRPHSRTIALRARRTGPDDPIATDRVPPMHFAVDPGAWFDQDGRFSVRICGLPAAVGSPQEGRLPVTTPASLAVADGAVSLTVLDQETDGITVPIRVTVCAVTVDGATGMPDTAAGSQERARIDIDAAGHLATTVVLDATPVPAGRVVMLKLEPVGAVGALMPGAILDISGGTPAAGRSSSAAALVDEGFLDGALAVRLPRIWVLQRRWLYLAADGSVALAQTATAGVDADIPLDLTTGMALPASETTTGPGPSWPPLPLSAAVDRISRLPGAPGRGPTVMHGGQVLDAADAPVGGGVSCALVFAARSLDAGVAMYRPMRRLRWTGDDPTTAVWEILDDSGVPAADPIARSEALRQWAREDGPNNLQLAVRMESSLDGARLLPAEVSWSSWDGEAVLIHLPELLAEAATSDPNWATPAPWSAASEIVTVAQDGATWWGTGVARHATGTIAPLAGPRLHRRRRVRWRSLCPWRAETAVDQHAGCQPGWLEVDPAHGLLALALIEPPQPQAPSATGDRPPNVTVCWQEGYTAHIGARSTAREPALNLRQPPPTRVVSRSGTLHTTAEGLAAGVTWHTTLAAALAAIDADATGQPEVIRFEDSATYAETLLSWPTSCADLTIQAAERHRPIIHVTTWNAPTTDYERLTLRGVVLSGADVTFPRTEALSLQYCTGHATLWTFLGDDEVTVTVDHCLTPGLALSGPGTLSANDSVIDAGDGAALSVPDDTLRLERCTVIGSTACMVLHASECVLAGGATATDRFQGCVRYSAVPTGAQLPRRYRVFEGDLPLFVSPSRHDPAHARLAVRNPDAIRFGAEDGDEMGGFHEVQAALRQEALLRRLTEYTPAGLKTGLIRVD